MIDSSYSTHRTTNPSQSVGRYRCHRSRRSLERFFGSGANASVADNDEEKEQFVSIEDLFKGRHLEEQIIILCRLVHELQVELRDQIIMMTGPAASPCRILRFSSCEENRGSGANSGR